MSFSLKNITHFRLFLLLGVLSGSLFVFVSAFATVNEKTIHVFGTTVETEGWEDGKNALNQSLSGSAIFDDFNNENSAHLIKSNWTSNEDDLDNEIKKEEILKENSSTTDKKKVDAVKDYKPMADATPLDFVAGMAHGLFAPNADAEEVPADDVNNEEVQTETVVEEVLPQENSDELANTIEETVVQDSEENLQEANVVDSVNTATDENEENSDIDEIENDVKNDSSDENDNDVNLEGDEESVDTNENNTDESTSTDELSDINTEATSSEDVDANEETEGHAGGSGTNTNTSNKDKNNLKENDDVTICSILDSECHILTIKGFGLGWDLGEFDAKDFTLNLSIGADAEASVNDGDKLYIRYYDGYKWHIASMIDLHGELSNYTNGGYFAFPLPEITNWRKLDDLEVQIEYVHGGSKKANVFVESAWIDIKYESPDNENLPELPHLSEELKALEDSADPDTLVLGNDKRINFEHTDENDDETLIIKTDKKIYEGLTHAKVYFNITNTGSRKDKFSLQAHFPESRGEVKSLKRFTKNIPREVKTPVYQPMAQTCSSVWRYNKELNEQNADGDIEAHKNKTSVRKEKQIKDKKEDALENSSNQNDTETENSSQENTETQQKEIELKDGDEKQNTESSENENKDEEVKTELTSTSTNAEESDSEAGENTTENTGTTTAYFKSIKPLHDTTPLEFATGLWSSAFLVRANAQTDESGQQNEDVVLGEDDGAIAEDVTPQGIQETEDAPDDNTEEENLSQETDKLPEDEVENQNTQSVEDYSDENVTSTSTSDNTEESVSSDDNSSENIDDTEGADTDLRIEEILKNDKSEAVSGFYTCPDDDTVLYCDSLNSDKNNCIQNSVQVGTETHTEYEDGFLDIALEKGEHVVKYDLFTKAAQLLGIKPERKDVPKSFVVKESTEDLYSIEPGQTLYFEMEITYPAKSKGEFFLEAIGKKGGYGLLDPWWNSGWIYRMPLYVDNTNGATTTEQQIYLELDSSLGDFWNHVQDDGDDMRFMREYDTTGDWYDSSWAKRIELTVQSSKVSTTTTDYPVYVNLADLGSDFFSNINSDGGDIRVTTDDKLTELPREVVSASTTAKTGELYFRANNISSTTDTTFYIYFGNGDATDYASSSTYGSQNVWTNNFTGVWHMNDETSTTIKDSTSGNYTGTKGTSGYDSTEVTGHMGSAQYCDGSDYIDLGDVLDPGTSDWSVEVWYEPTAVGGTNRSILYNKENLYEAAAGGNVHTYAWRPHWAWDGGSSFTTAVNNWYASVEKYDHSAQYMYKNGSQVYTRGQSGDIGTNSSRLQFCARGDTNHSSFFTGNIDEIRMSSVARSAGWISTTYNNQATSSEFYATSTTETYVGPVNQELDFWTQYFSSTTEEARVWLQVDELAGSASTTIYMYYGNAGASSVSDQYAPFEYSTSTDLYYLLRDDASAGDSMLVYSYTDDNIVKFSDFSASSTLSRGQSTSTQSFSSTTVVSATGPLSAKYEDSGAKNFDSLVPVGFASTTFTVAPRNGGTELWYVGSPFGSASVTIWNGSATTSFTVATGTVHYESFAVANDYAGVVESDIPVLLAYEYNTADGMTPYPATTRSIYGIRSNSVYVGITQNNTTMDVSCSTAASSTSASYSRGDRYTSTVCGNGSNGAGEAVRLYNATSPIGADQNADSDGGEASVFWPVKEFSSEYMIPVTTSYISIACAPEIGEVSISLYDTSNTVVANTTCTPGDDNPGKAYFGTDDDNNYSAGYYVKSTDSPAKPFYAYYEDHTDVGDGSNGGDEQNFTGPVQGRKFAYPELSYDFGGEELSTETLYVQSDYRWYANEDAEPPTDPWPVGTDDDLSENEEATAIYAVSTGDVIRLRTGITITNVPVTAGDNNFKLQYTESDACDSGGLSWSDVGAIGTGGPWIGYDNSSLTDGATLSTTTISGADILGSYVEENDSAMFPNDIAVGEEVEHDWVLKNNGANTNSSYCFRAVQSDGTAFPTYTRYPRIETNSAPGEPTKVAPFDNAKIWDLTPNMRFVATDIASDDIHYQVQIDDNFDFTSPEVDASSASDPTSFSNVTNSSNKAPFTSGNVVQYTVPSNLSNGTTYYWRVRGKDPNGSNEWGEWSDPPNSFTTDTGISVSTWYQTTQEQFSTDVLEGVEDRSTDDVRLPGTIAEYGTATTTDEGWTTVTLSHNFTDMVVVASPRYAGGTVAARTARIRNKTSNTFDVKVAGSATTTVVAGDTLVDYMAVEAGEWTIEDGGSGTHIEAGTKKVSGIYCRTAHTTGPRALVTFSSAFSSAPVVIHTVSSNNDSSWITSSVDDGSSTANEPTTSSMGIWLQEGYGYDVGVCYGHDAEDVDYVAFEPGHHTALSDEFEALNSSDTIQGVNTSGAPWPQEYSTEFSSAPGVTIVAMPGVDGSDGGFAMVDTRTTATSGTIWLGIDEDGSGVGGTADRGHTTEPVSIIAFGNDSGTLKALFSGKITSTAVDFDDAEVGNRWDSASWNDTETGGTILYQVEYFGGGQWQAVPDTEIPDNSTGTTTSPISLFDLDTSVYNQLRLVGNFTSPSTTTTPILSDWTISWNQSVYTPTHSSPFDNEKVSTTSPTLEFSTSDPEGDSLTYEVEWSTDRTFTTASSSVSDTDSGFANKTTTSDTSPFNSGDTITFTIPADALSNGTTYWWRVRAKDPVPGSDIWSFWSDEDSFTVDTSLSVSTWHQTTQEQFDNDSLSGVKTMATDDVQIQTDIGEWGTTTATAGTWETINFANTYSNPVVVASVRYSPGNSDHPRGPRIKNKTSTSFQLLVSNFDTQGESAHDTHLLNGASTTVDWIVMEEGDWTIDDGGSGLRVVAGTESDVSGIQKRPYSDSVSANVVTFSPAFSNTPIVLTTISSENDSHWVWSGADDTSSYQNPPTTSTLGLYLQRGYGDSNHSAEDIDYIAFEPGHGTNDSVEFDVSWVSYTSTYVDCCTAGGDQVSFNAAFTSATPTAFIVAQQGVRGGDGSWMSVENYNTQYASTTGLNLTVDEDGPDIGSRAHTQENSGIVSFASSSGSIKRVSTSLSGTIDSQPIVFSDGSGPKWGEFLWNDLEPSTSEILYHVYYATGSTYELIPDADLPDNSTGTSTSPIDLGGVDINTYSTLKVRGAFTCTSGGTCPTLYDWTVNWSEGITVSGTVQEYDESTNVTSGIVRIALNGVLQTNTGTISSGTWSINNVNAFPDDIITVWIDGADEANEAVAVTKYDGANDVTGMKLFERHLTLGSDDNPTLTNTDLAQYDNSVSGDEDIVHDVDGFNDLTSCVSGNGCSDVVLYVMQDTTYRPDSASSGNVDTHDMRIYGDVVADNNTFTVSGSWDNNNGFDSGNSEIIFTATSSEETIDSTGSATSTFYSITFGQTNGHATWTAVTNLDVDDSFGVQYGTYFASTSSTNIGGNLTVGSNGIWLHGTATTTFDGSGVANWTDNTANGQNFGKVLLNGTTKTVRLQSDILLHDITILSGNTLDVTANDYSLEVQGDFRNGGSFNAQEGTVTFTATTTGRVIDSGPSNFYDLVFDGVGGNWAFPVSDVTVDNDFTITNGIVTSPTGTLSVGGSFDASGGTFVHNNATVKMTSSNTGETVTPGGNPFYNLTFFGSAGGWSFGQSNATTSNDFTVLSGDVTLPSDTLVVTGSFENEAGSFDANNGTVLFNAASIGNIIKANNSHFNNILFDAAGSGGNWYNSSWKKRIELTIQSSKVDATTTNFPVYVNLADLGSGFFSNINSDGGDVRITASDKVTELPREVVSASTTAKTGELYFRANSISSTTDSTFYIYFDNDEVTDYASSSAYGSQNVWSNGYTGVWHMNNGSISTTIEDSTSGNYIGTKGTSGNDSAEVAGHMGRAQYCDGNDYIDLGDVLDPGTSDWSVEVWYEPTAVGGTNRSILYNKESLYEAAAGGNVHTYAWQPHWAWDGGSSFTTVVNNWYASVEKYDHNAQYMYKNGSQVYTRGQTGDIGTNSSRLQFCARGDTGHSSYFTGNIDEIRMSSVARSAEWLSTTYNNQATSSEFYATSTIEVSNNWQFVDANVYADGNVTIEDGTVYMPSGDFTLYKSFINSNGTFEHNDGTMLFAATTTGHTVTAGESDFYDVTFNGVGGGWTVDDNATSTNNLSLLAGDSIVVNSGIRMAVQGVFVNDVPDITTWTGSTLALLSGTSYTVGSKTQLAETYGTLEIGTDTDIRMWQSNASSYNVDSTGSLYSQDHANNDGDLYIWGDYNRTSGSDYWSTLTDFDGTGIAGAPRVTNVYFANGASATFANATLEMKGTSTATTTVSNQGSGTYSLIFSGGTVDAEYYSITDTDAYGLQLLASSTVTSLTNGAFTLSTNGGSMITVSSTTVDTNSELQIQNVSFATSSGIALGYNVSLQGTPSSFWWFRNHTGNYAGEVYDNDGGDPGEIRWDDSGYTINVSGAVYAGEGAGGAGTVCDGATHVVTLCVNGGSAYTTTCDSGSGAYTFTNVTFSGDVPLVVYLATSTGPHSATVSRTPTGDITGLDVYEHYVIVRHEDVDPLAISHMAVYDNDDDSNIPFNAATTTGLLSVDSNTSLLVWAGKEFAPGGNVTLNSSGSGTSYDGTLVLQATSTLTSANTETYSIGGSWKAESDSTFTSANSNVDFTATTTGKNITSYSSFNDVTFSGANGSWRVATPMTVSNDITMSQGTLYGTSSVTVQNGTVTGNGIINMSGGTFSVENGGNFGGSSDWSFNNLTFGDGVGGSTTKIGSGDITVNGVLTVNTNHTLNAGSVNWTLLGSGNVFNVSGTFNADTSTTTYASTTSMTVATLGYNNLVLSPQDSGTPTYTFNAGNLTANSMTVGDGVNGVNVDDDTNDALITISGDVNINSGATYNSSGSNDILIGGSYKNNGTFTANTGSVVFNSTDTGETIDPGASAFNNVLINGIGGGWTIVADATTTGSFSIQNANSLTLASGNTLEVQGVFTNNVGGGATTWSGSTLYLNSGTNYTINTKIDGSDVYATLKIGGNTDIRMWNSTSTLYTVDNSGSLYSMDHNSVDGDLYIWGDYNRTSGSDYWSYAIDFDGTDLASTSDERRVDVYLADNAGATLSGGELEIVGDANASTTVQNQGSGNYALSITGGTFKANYYKVRNINADGISFSGTPTVTSLSDGDLLLQENGGAMLTIAGSVLDENSVKTWYRIKFATSSGITSGYNASTTGSSVSSWRFTPALGNYYGETHDGDGAGDPGYLIWDDSAADITVQGHVYSDEGTTVSGVCDGATQVVRLLVAGASAQTASCASSDGLYTISGITYSPGDTITVYLDTNGGARAANVTIDPITSIYNMDLYENRVIVRHEDVNPITINDLSIYDSDQDSDIPFDADTGSPNTFITPANTKLIVWDSKSFEPGGNITLNSGSGTSYDGTIELQDNASLVSSSTVSETISVGGSWLTGNGATFTSGISSVNMLGTSSSMVISPDSSSFYDLTFNGTGGTWTFADTNATTTNDFTITNGTVNVASSTLAVGGSFINSGSMSAASTTMTFSSTDPETVTFNGDSVGSIVFSGSGNFDMTDSYATSTGSVLISAGSVTLPAQNFAVRASFENTGGIFTQNNGTLNLYGGEAAKTLQVNNSDLHNLSITGGGSWIFTDTVATTTGTTSISSGGLTAPSERFAIGGSLINDGSYNSNGGLTYFFATSTGQTINGGGAVFADVVLNGTGGGWTVSTSSTSTGAWLIENGSEFNMASSTTLEVRGVFENLIGGSGTDWTDSTLYLNASGTSYTINTKTAGGDDYANLVIGENTDVRMWNSAAATTSIATTTASLYSMDNNNIDGSLYIWGEYTHTSGTDYWSYDTDFDGTSLGGGSRAVSVYVASSSAISYTGGSLEVVGTASATTTVALQNTGAYSFDFSGSSLNMQYYQLRGLDSSGFVISGTPTVTSLAHGDLSLAHDDWVMMDVSASVIDQNPTKTFSGMWFGTSTGVATGTNVKVNGSASNYWKLTSSGGSFDGESHDDDGTDACGSIRWDDSICLEVSQAHYRFRADDGGEGAPSNEWMDEDWSYRKRITVTNPNSSDLTNYPVRLEIAYEADMQSDYDDLRFTDSSGTTTIPYYVEDTTSATATVWAKIPTLTGSANTNIFVYYGNSFAANAESGSNTFTVIDDFEDNDITDYSGDTTLFDANTSFAFQKSYGLSAASGKESEKTTNGIYKTGTSIPQGSTIEFYQQVESGQDDEPCTYFGVQGSGQNYAVCLDQYPNDVVVLAKDVTSNDGSGTTIATSSITYTSGTHWYKVSIDWLSDDSIDVTVYDDSDSSVATISDSDGSYSSGGFGFGFWYQNKGWDFFTARPYAASDPTYTVGSAQVGGGASWKAAQDTSISQDSNTNFRVRMSVENSGATIDSQQFRLQYASKTGYGSCEAVPDTSYDDVPSASACGVSEVCMVSSPEYDDQDSTSQHLDTISSLDFTSGYMVEDPSNQTNSMSLATSTLTEVEYAIELTSYASESSYCLRTTNGGIALDSYAHVPEVSVNGVPVITSWSLNSDASIALTEGQTTVVMATGSVTDLNGSGDLSYATTTIYRSGLNSKCGADDNNCYRLTSLDCPFTNCSGNTCDVECTANIEFFADPTDVGSAYESEDWVAELFVVDQTNNVATTTSLGVELLTLWGLSVTSGDIGYGSIEIGKDTGAFNVQSTLQNTGNESIDIQLDGTDMTSGSSSIPVGNQKYATSSFTYSACTICAALASTTNTLEVDLAKPTTTTPVTDDLYWGLYVPSGVNGTTHYGHNTFYAVSD